MGWEDRSVVEDSILFEVEFFCHRVHVHLSVNHKFTWWVDLEEVGGRPFVRTIGNGSTGNINGDSAAADLVPGADIRRAGGAIHGFYMGSGGENARHRAADDIPSVVLLLCRHDHRPAEGSQAPSPPIQAILRDAGKEAREPTRSIARVVINLDAKNIREIFDRV
jgi:hypothetical protein